jgi:D-alanyl-D-alanine carboxypeptidase
VTAGLITLLRREPRRNKKSKVKWVIAAIAAGPFLFMGLALVLFAAGGADPNLTQPRVTAVAGIPPAYLALYQEAAAAQGIDWAVLAGIGKVECDHGRSQLRGCNPVGTVNVAGARGPMQFLGSTWRAGAGTFDADVTGAPTAEGQENQGYATDGNNDGLADPWQPADAIHAAARYLHRNGAPGDYNAAIWAYNHSDAYRSNVLRWAETYRAAATQPAPAGVAVPGPVPLTTVRGITVHTTISAQLDAMVAAAAADGVQLSGSGYRSHDRQIELRRQHCGTSDYAIFEMPSSQCSPPTARPGSSLHEQGLAVDFVNCSSHSTACYQWLNGHASGYGFFNLPSEPWHWSIDGR